MSHEKNLKLAVKFRFLRIPTKWSLETDQHGRLQAVPHLIGDPNNVAMVDIDGWELRRRFLQLQNGDGKAVLRFLDQVGVWILEDPGIPVVMDLEGLPRQFFSGVFGSRFAMGTALPVSRERLQDNARGWNELLMNRSALKQRFSPLPAAAAGKTAKDRYAWSTWSMNSLNMHIEWHGGNAFAVVETITAWEMLVATTHLDLLRGSKFGICQRKDCAIAFPKVSKHDRKYCSQACAHLVAVRKSRKRKKQEENHAAKW
jgi:hypothetical protein